MAKQIIFTYDGKDYTLEYTRRTIKQMEDEGFVARMIDDRPMTLLPALFAGAFKAHHRFAELNRLEGAILDLYDKLTNEMYGRRMFTWNFGMKGGGL